MFKPFKIFFIDRSRIFEPHLWSNGQSSWVHNGDVLWFL
jgi:hypothetical protein